MNRLCKIFFVGLLAVSGEVFICSFSDAANSITSKIIPDYTYKIINKYPHDRNAFTQGLAYENGCLYEGTGLYGQSTLRRVRLETGEVLKIRRLPPIFFGEGVTIYRNEIVQLTYRSRVGFVYDKNSFTLMREFDFQTQGWGITHDGRHLIMSDGTATLHYLDPTTFKKIGQIQVRDTYGPVKNLNELEYIHGQVYANVWKTNRIVKIDSQTGKVIGWIDLEGLLRAEDLHAKVDVLNGIAYDTKNARLFVTGKWWPKIFEIKLISLK